MIFGDDLQNFNYSTKQGKQDALGALVNQVEPYVPRISLYIPYYLKMMVEFASPFMGQHLGRIVFYCDVIM